MLKEKHLTQNTQLQNSDLLCTEYNEADLGKKSNQFPSKVGDESESIGISKRKRGHIIDKLLIFFLKLTF